MKKILLICCLVIGITAARAQGTHPTVGTPEEKAKGLQKALKLNDKQTEKITAIYKESAEKFDKIKKEEHGNTDKMVVAVRPLREATVKKIKAVLTPVQAAKYDKMVKDSSGGGNGWSDGWSSTN
jgi:protein CpxP